ncbi:Hypothetical predicted protein [Marmota monax]|uniref:MAGE domain-containing protein n=1 Tax=Marmota monax TaxID=9995 RepID=A0A5E4DAK9_MARMO|nr:hypothetical protein GHT09_016599 [Marmota monax]VTJ91108.1 Hypothetical predicted protein [Marmota monax]
MVKYVVGDLKDLFPEIIARAAEHLRYVFGFELKQLDRKHHTYILIHKLKPLEEEEDLGGDGPRLGLLMMILGLIYMKGNSVREAQVWDMLRRLGVLPSKSTLGTRKGLLWKNLCSSDTSITGGCLTRIHWNMNSLGSLKQPGNQQDESPGVRGQAP